VVGHRDKRFGFNNKSMKIGERKRNDMSKVVKENVGPNLGKNTKSIKNARNSQIGKSHRELANRKHNHLAASKNKGEIYSSYHFIDSKFEEEKIVDDQHEISKPGNKLQKFKTPMRSIYIDKLEPVLHKSFKAFLIKRVRFGKSKFLETISEN
jgi:hypothetical protein